MHTASNGFKVGCLTMADCISCVVAESIQYNSTCWADAIMVMIPILRGMASLTDVCLAQRCSVCKDELLHH